MTGETALDPLRSSAPGFRLAVTSARSSPGATSLVVALAWTLRQPTTIIEADPTGGVLATRFGLATRRDLASFLVNSRRSAFSSELLAHHSAPFANSSVLAAPANPNGARRAVEALSRIVSADGLPATDHPILLDLGAMTRASPAVPILGAADALVVVTNTAADSMHSVLELAEIARQSNTPAGLVTIGDRPYKPGAVEDICALRLLAALPEDRRTSRAYVGGTYGRGQLRRSRLHRSIAHFARSLENGLSIAASADPPREARPHLTNSTDPKEDARV